MIAKVTENRRKSLVVTPNHVMDLLSFVDSTYQLHIFLLILENLKGFAQKEFDNHLSGQRSLFGEEVIVMQIALSEISNASEYRDVKKAFLNMSKIHCEIKYDESNERKIWSGSLFSVSIPVVPNYSSFVKIRMDVVVAKLFINFRRNQNRLPAYYSKLDTNIRLFTRTKNTIKLYLYLSLWRSKSQINVKLDDLCLSMGLPKAYRIPSNFKKHILEPAREVLRKFNDVWFDFDRSSIHKSKEGSYHLRLKLTTREKSEAERMKAEQIENILRLHFGFHSADIKEMEAIIRSAPKDQFIDKLLHLSNGIGKVKHKVSYVKKSLINRFQA
jgi:plasmid replication initiation protein